MLILKHLKTLQHVSIIIQIIFRELVRSLLKSLSLKNLLGIEVQMWFVVCARTHTNKKLCCRITTFNLLYS
jgi:hypothetical protein